MEIGFIYSENELTRAGFSSRDGDDSSSSSCSSSTASAFPSRSVFPSIGLVAVEDDLRMRVYLFEALLLQLVRDSRVVSLQLHLVLLKLLVQSTDVPVHQIVDVVS